jgi:predicted DNA binding protein
MGTNGLEWHEDPVEPSLEDRDLRAVLEIERGGPCRLDTVEGDVLGIDVRLDDDVCNVDAVVREPEDGCVSTRFFENDLCEHCPGKVFAEHDCLPRYRELHPGRFTVETYIPNTEAVADLVGDIRDICDRVSLKSIVSTDGSGFPENCSVDITALTEKQREAVYHAQRMGYYDPTSDVSLDALADRIGISTSALSQRLQRAEGNLIRQLSIDD